jgi:hypothetical protein
MTSSDLFDFLPDIPQLADGIYRQQQLCQGTTTTATLAYPSTPFTSPLTIHKSVPQNQYRYETLL